MSDEHRLRLDQLHAAILAPQTRREVRPLGLFFWSGVWTLVPWCELRNGFRTFRIDRVAEVDVESAAYTPRSKQSLADYLATVTGPSTQSTKDHPLLPMQ